MIDCSIRVFRFLLQEVTNNNGGMRHPFKMLQQTSRKIGLFIHFVMITSKFNPTISTLGIHKVVIWLEIVLQNPNHFFMCPQFKPTINIYKPLYKSNAGLSSFIR